MDVVGWLKRMFPKPNIPQKRYLIAAGFVLYWALKIYTSTTPDKTDDVLPDLIKSGVVKMVCDAEDDSPAA